MTLVAGGQEAAQVDNVLPYPDQALFLALRGAGQEAVMQVLWIYEHPLDLDGLRRFHENFSRGVLARRIEPSPLPFGRHRWVASGPPPEIDICDRPRDRGDLHTWADEQVDLPLDPQWGPGWRLGVQPFTDGSTAVSLVVSHCIADGGAVVIAVMHAIMGMHRQLGYPEPRSRTRLRALGADLRQFGRDLPEIGRTLRKGIKVALARRKEITSRPKSALPAVAGGGEVAHVPSVSVFVDSAQWDQRAGSLGGNSFSLVAGYAGKVAQHLNRTRKADGMATLIIPVDEREDFSDAAGNVVALANVSFDPARVTEDLTEARTAIREALKKARAVPDEMIELLPLIPFLPKRAIAPMADAALGFSADLPVSCSNMGDLPPDCLRVDGTPAEYLTFRGVDRRVLRETLERRSGLLTVASGRVSGRIINTIISYQPGGDNSQEHLREVALQSLTDFGLSGEVL
ncbi:MAG: hypothetical protein ACR2JM_05060 [Mycobacterium sp.]